MTDIGRRIVLVIGSPARHYGPDSSQLVIVIICVGVIQIKNENLNKLFWRFTPLAANILTDDTKKIPAALSLSQMQQGQFF